MPKNFHNQKAFTLIELMIVVMIISILVAFTFVAFSQVQKNARDAQRKGDLQAVAGALQRFYSDNAKYPASSATGQISYNNSDCPNDTDISPIPWGTGFFSCGGKSYLKQLPSDPQSTQYCYTRTDLSGNPSTQFFQLLAKLEGAGNLSSTVSCGSKSGYNYRVTPND